MKGAVSPAEPVPVLVGRDRNASQIVVSLISGRSMVVLGNQGFGKTFLLESVSGLLLGKGLVPIRLYATALLDSAAFGSISNGSNLVFAAALGNEIAVTAARFLDVASRLSGTQPIILVDDAHLLDAYTMDVLYQLASGRAITVLLTSDLAAISTEPQADDDTRRLIDELWTRGTAERIDLDPLSRAESAQLVNEMAPDANFDRIAVALLHDQSGGSRAILRELTADAVWQHDNPDEVRNILAQTPSRRLLDLLAHQVRALDPGSIASLALIGRLGGLAESRASLVCGPSAVRNLLHRGCVRFDTARPGVLLAQALLSEVANDLCSAIDLNAQTALVVELLLTDRLRQLPLTRVECVVIADIWISTAGMPDAVIDRWGPAIVAEVLLTAARWSRSVGASQSSLLYAGFLVQVAPGVTATIELSRSLASTGQLAAAVELVDSSAAAVDQPSEGVELGRWAQSLSKFNYVAADHFAAFALQIAAVHPDNPVLLGEVDYARMILKVRAFDMEATAVEGEEIARNTEYDRVTRIRSACMSAVAHAYAGRSKRGLTLLKLATTLNEIGHLRANGDSGLALEIFYSRAGVCCLGGLDLTTIDGELDRWIGNSIASKDFGNLMLLSLVAARLQSVAMAATDAASTSDSAAHGENDWRLWVLCLESSPLASLGVLEAARASRVAVQRAPALGSATGSPVSSESALGRSEDVAILSHANLTRREKEVDELVIKGLSNRQIAAMLFVSVRTVESHRYQASIKTGNPRRIGDDLDTATAVDDEKSSGLAQAGISAGWPPGRVSGVAVGLADGATLDDLADDIVRRIRGN